MLLCNSNDCRTGRVFVSHFPSRVNVFCLYVVFHYYSQSHLHVDCENVLKFGIDKPISLLRSIPLTFGGKVILYLSPCTCLSPPRTVHVCCLKIKNKVVPKVWRLPIHLDNQTITL